MTPNRSNAIGRVVANWLQLYRDKGCPIRDVARDGRDHFGVWLQAQTAQNRARVQARIDRIKVGNFGDHKGLGKGVSELRIDFGPGYRVYYGRDGDSLVILLAGGTKKRQARDIEKAQALWNEYKQERRDAHTRI